MLWKFYTTQRSIKLFNNNDNCEVYNFSSGNTNIVNHGPLIFTRIASTHIHSKLLI